MKTDLNQTTTPNGKRNKFNVYILAHNIYANEGVFIVVIAFPVWYNYVRGEEQWNVNDMRKN